MNTNKIVQAIRDNGISIHELSVKCKVGYATLYDIVKGNTLNPRIETISKITQALNIPINELLNKEEDYEESNT